jgi:hypothetical protein
MSLQSTTGGDGLLDAVDWSTVTALLATAVGVTALALGLFSQSAFVVVALMASGMVLAYGLRSLWHNALSADDGGGGASASGRTTGGEADVADGESPADPVEVLKLRYARGDLSDEAFERRLGRLVELEDGGDAGAVRTGDGSRENEPAELEEPERR